MDSGVHIVLSIECKS
jgi:hypothetical protein